MSSTDRQWTLLKGRRSWSIPCFGLLRSVRCSHTAVSGLPVSPVPSSADSFRAGVHAPTKSVLVSASISLLPPVQPRSGVHTHTDKIGIGATKQRHTTRKTSAHQSGVFIEGVADMSVVVLITLSCRRLVLPGHKVTWNINTTDIAAGAYTDFVGACTPAPYPWRWGRQVVPKRRYQTTLRRVTNQKTEYFISAAVEALNHARQGHVLSVPEGCSHNQE